MNRKTVKAAFQASVPVFAGYVVLGIGFGILLQKAGYGTGMSLAMSAFIYAGSMQYVGVSLLSGAASILTAFLTTVAVNARHIFYSISMVEKFEDTGWRKPYLIFALTDETYSLLCSLKAPEGVDERNMWFLIALMNQCYWVLGSILGTCMGEFLPFDTAGIEFSMTALFLSTFVEQWTSSKDHVSALCGLLISAVCLLIFGPGRFLIPAMVLITAALGGIGTVRKRRAQ